MRYGEPIPYICPEDRLPLRSLDSNDETGTILAGQLETACGKRYRIVDGIMDFVSPTTLTAGDAVALEEYDRVADVYDELIPITFNTVCDDEFAVRKEIVKKLEVGPGSTVLEVGCGTGRDTMLIVDLLADTGIVYAQDISLPSLKKCASKFAGHNVRIEFARANASAIPLPDACCDAAFHFGGLNTFTHLQQALAEMARVCRDGGRVVVGDEGIAPWMRSSLIGRVLMHNNPLYCSEPPLSLLPTTARNVQVEWVFSGIFYVIAFHVSRKEPEINLDIPIPGKRGGTNRTRFFGKLEGVKPDTRELALMACQEAGKSMHDWLDAVVRSAAERDLRASLTKPDRRPRSLPSRARG